jgi:hypothetical protein
LVGGFERSSTSKKSSHRRSVPILDSRFPRPSCLLILGWQPKPVAYIVAHDLSFADRRVQIAGRGRARNILGVDIFTAGFSETLGCLPLA